MSTDALDLRAEGARVIQIWPVGDVSCRYGRDEVGDGMHADQSQEGLVPCREMHRTSRVRSEDTADIRSHRQKCSALGMVEQQLVYLLGKALSKDAIRRLLFDVEAADWLHGHRVPRTQICSY